MSLQLGQLPSFFGPIPTDVTRVDRHLELALPAASRRQFLKAAMVVGMGAGMAVLGWLPPARKAMAGHPNTDGYEIKDLPCPTTGGSPPNGWDQTNTNCMGCCCSTVCSDCCQTDSSSPHHGWHRTTGVVYCRRPSVSTG